MRRAHDQYDTEAFATETLLACATDIVGPRPAGRSIIEPCAGEHRITAVLRAKAPGARIFTNDLHPRAIVDKHMDATYRPCWEQFPPAEWVVTNPPFVDAMAILQQAYRHATEGVAMLLRLTFLEPTEERGEWLALNPPDQMVVLPRYSFTGDGKTDSVTCAWMIWRHRVAEGQARGIRVVPRPKPAKMLLDHIEEQEKPDGPLA
jgi:hypothetical protein